MKKIAAIFFLSLMVFTTAGYRILVGYLEYRERDNLQAVIEQKAYNPAHLIELTAELSLPYLNDWQTWESVEGVVTIGGTPYQYVERMLKGGRMHYRCLPNNGMEHLLSARDRFMQLSYDFIHQGGQKQSASAVTPVKPPVMDLFWNENFSISHLLAGRQLNQFPDNAYALPVPLFLSVPTPPPNMRA